MKLRYISIHMYDSGYGKKYESDFSYHCRFISNYLSIQIRKLKFETDGTFKMIGVKPTLHHDNVCKIRGEDALSIQLSSFI